MTRRSPNLSISPSTEYVQPSIPEYPVQVTTLKKIRALTKAMGAYRGRKFGWKNNGDGSTLTFYDIFCPVCGLPGQVKARFRNYRFKPSRLRPTTKYYVDHYRTLRRLNGYHGKYKSSCYLGDAFQVGPL